MLTQAQAQEQARAQAQAHIPTKTKSCATGICIFASMSHVPSPAMSIRSETSGVCEVGVAERRRASMSVLESPRGYASICRVMKVGVASKYACACHEDDRSLSRLATLSPHSTCASPDRAGSLATSLHISTSALNSTRKAHKCICQLTPE